MKRKRPPLLLARTNWRSKNRLFGVKQRDRMQHMYVLGQTGTGKTTLLQNMIWQDALCREGIAFLDPHGDACEEITGALKDRREDDLLYLDVADPECELRFNPLVGVPSDQHALATTGVVEAMRKVWTGTAWGPRMEHVLRNSLMTLLAQPHASLGDLGRLFSDKPYRVRAIKRVDHAPVLEFWEKEFASYAPRYRSEVLAPIRNKLGAFLSQPAIHQVLTAGGTQLDLRELMDDGRLLLVNLAKGRIGADGASLLGSLLLSSLSLAGLSRADSPEANRRPFFIYLDEFHSFSTTALADMLSELRKYGLSLTLAHQYVRQIKEEVRQSVLGNVGTIVCFRIGPEDAVLMQRLFRPDFVAEDLIYLPNHDCYVRLLVEGEATRPFSARTLAPLWKKTG